MTDTIQEFNAKRNKEIEQVSSSSFSLPETKISDYYKELKVAALVGDENACGYYRVIFPLHMLKLHGAQVTYSSASDLNTLRDADVIVFPRQHHENIYEVLRQLGWDKIIIYELDDDLHAVEPNNPAYRVYHLGSPEWKMIPQFIKSCHGMTVTTREIAKRYFKYNQNIALIPNFIDFSLRNWNVDVSWEGVQPTFTTKPIPRPEEYGNDIIIQYQGGSSHGDDIKVMGPDLAYILKKYDNVKLSLYSNFNLVEKFIEEFKLPKDKVLTMPAKHFLDHPTGMFGCDIQLAPVVSNQFNLAKSNLKILEAGAAGCAVVASNVGPYAEFNAEFPNTILPVGKGENNYSTWREALEYLIQNRQTLDYLKEKTRNTIIQNYSLEANFHRWPNAWKTIWDQCTEGKVGPPEEAVASKVKMGYGSVGRNDKCPCGSGRKYKGCCYGSYGN